MLYKLRGKAGLTTNGAKVYWGGKSDNPLLKGFIIFQTFLCHRVYRFPAHPHLSYSDMSSVCAVKERFYNQNMFWHSTWHKASKVGQEFQQYPTPKLNLHCYSNYTYRYINVIDRNSNQHTTVSKSRSKQTLTTRFSKTVNLFWGIFKLG
ncbi:hypothetical protein, partial [Vibrio cyclitrophicus]